MDADGSLLDAALLAAVAALTHCKSKFLYPFEGHCCKVLKESFDGLISVTNVALWGCTCINDSRLVF